MEFSLTTFGHLALLAHCGCGLSATLLIEYMQQVSINNTLLDSVLPVISGVHLGPPIISGLYEQYLF